MTDSRHDDEPRTPWQSGPIAPRVRVERAAARVALLLGLGHAAVSFYWLAGGTALLSTLGEQLESWGRERTARGLTLLAAVTVVKVVVAALAAFLAELQPFGGSTRCRRWARARHARAAGWLATFGLVAYGGIMTTAGILVDPGVVNVEPDEPRALRWHAYFWDPWFLLWGCALAVVMVATRPSARSPSTA